MTRSLKSLSRLIALPVGLAGAVYALGNALGSGDWFAAAVLGVVALAGVWAISPDGRTVATRHSPSPTSGLGPDGRVSTIAGER